MSARALRALAALTLAGAVAAVAARPASAVSPPAPAAAAAAPAAVTGPAGLRLLAQTAFVDRSGVFHSRLAVSSPAPSTDTLAVAVYTRLGTRSAFDQAVGGRLPGGVIYRVGPKLVAGLSGDAAGGVDLDIPVNSSGGPTRSFNARSGSAVYPVSYQLYSRAGVPLGAPLTSFLVYSGGVSPDFPRLSVSLTVPVAGPADTTALPARLPPSAAGALGELIDVLAAHPDIPLTLSISPDTLARLAAGTPADGAALAALAHRVAGGTDQILPASYLPVSVPALLSAGLSAEWKAQLAAGASTLGALLGRAPSPSAAVAGDGLDAATLAALGAGGATHVILPDGDLSPLPAADRRTTFANPTPMSGRAAPPLQVDATDTGLSAMLGPGGDQVLAGHNVLAGLAVIQLERPADTRGVALVAPSASPAPGASPDSAATSDPTAGVVGPALLDTVLAGLTGNPFAAAVTADGLFRAVPPAPLQTPRTLVVTRPTAPLSEGAAVGAARRDVTGLLAIIPDAARSGALLEAQLLLSTSSAIGDGERRGLLAGIEATVHHTESGIALPGSSSVTLTARRGTIPLTVLSNASLDARVEVRMSSTKLAFRPFTPPGGRCSVAPSNAETCQLVLTSEATTLRVPVESRTSGVFALEVTLGSPDGSVVLATNRDTVRSTAFSQAGVVLIVLAALGLAVWWMRDIRHGRRARQLVEPPVDDPLSDGVASGEQSRDEGAVVPRIRRSAPPAPLARRPAGPVDAMITEFFSSPPPRYGRGHDAGDEVSPSGPHRGPIP